MKKLLLILLVITGCITTTPLVQAMERGKMTIRQRIAAIKDRAANSGVDIPAKIRLHATVDNIAVQILAAEHPTPTISHDPDYGMTRGKLTIRQRIAAIQDRATDAGVHIPANIRRHAIVDDIAAQILAAENRPTTRSMTAQKKAKSKAPTHTQHVVPTTTRTQTPAKKPSTHTDRTTATQTSRPTTRSMTARKKAKSEAPKRTQTPVKKPSTHTDRTTATQTSRPTTRSMTARKQTTKSQTPVRRQHVVTTTPRTHTTATRNGSSQTSAPRNDAALLAKLDRIFGDNPGFQLTVQTGNGNSGDTHVDDNSNTQVDVVQPPVVDGTGDDAQVKDNAGDNTEESTTAWINNNKGKVTASAVAMVIAGLAVYNRDEICQAGQEAIAWMKKHKALSIIIITSIVAAGYSAYLYYNWDKGKDVGENITVGSVRLWENTLGKALIFAAENPKYMAITLGGMGIAGITAYVLSKKVATNVYDKITDQHENNTIAVN